MTIARASTLLFPWTRSFLSWLMAWFFFSASSLLWFCLAVTIRSATTVPAAPCLEALSRRDAVLKLDLEPVFALNRRPEVPIVPEPVLVVSRAGTWKTAVNGALAFTTSGTYSKKKYHISSLSKTPIRRIDNKGNILFHR